MTSSIATDQGKQGKAEPDANASAADPSNANRRFNPYDGMDPSNPNFVDISPEDFQAMMSKKKAMGIPSIDVLKEKTKKFNLQPGVFSVSNEKEGKETITKEADTQKKDENTPPLKTKIPSKWKKFLKMQKARVPDEAILQLAKVQGKTPTKKDVAELRKVLGMKIVDDEETDGQGSADSSASVGGPPPPNFQKFLKMQKHGIPKAAILQSAKVQGHDLSKLEPWLEKAGKETQGDNVSRAGDDNSDYLRTKFDNYIKMREKGVSIAFVLEAAKNQCVASSEIAELEKILAVVNPSKSTRAIIATQKTATAPRAKTTTMRVQGKTQSERFNEWFTPIPKKEEKMDVGDEDNEDDDGEKVAFHGERTSPLASLVRKMAHTVDKTRRKTGSKRGAVSKGDDDLVVTSKTLYQALGSFKGVQIARDSYNETLVAVGKSCENAPGSGWIRAKRQSFREIAKSIGVKLPSTTSAKSIGGAAEMVAVEGLDALVRYIEDRYSDEIQESLSLLRDDKLYDFDSLPTLYVPGSRVVAKNICSGGIDMICKVAWNRVKSGRTITGQISSHFEVCFEFVVAVGTNKATIAEVVEGIEEFEGRRNIFSSTGLTFVPWMAYNEEEQEVLLEKYRRRGRIYNEVALNHRPNNEEENHYDYQRPTYSYKAYRKGCFFVKRGGFGGTVNATSTSRGMATGGRIVIDSQGAYDYGNSLGVGYDPMITGIHYKLKEYRLHQSRSASDQQLTGSVSESKAHRIVDAAGNTYRSSGKPNSSIQDDADDGGMVLFDVIPEDYLELVWPSVIGFSLTAKAWGDCLVDGLDDISFSEDIFDRLVLPNERKRLIKALVKHSSTKSNVANKHNFQDLIKGKGEGTVFLLYGPPGVGKTLTAEAVAEVLRRPLYSLSMGTLGTTADDLERRLTEILKLSAKWDAIILLDEADSFLEKRSSASSLERNAMVSVMLQLVEYFTGILFLTSNRMDSLDPAFQTRITLSLPYYNLTEGGRQKIWENLLYKSGVVGKGLIDTSELAKHPLNGREIKNALRMALALACEEDCPLSQKLLMETSSMVKPISTFGNSYESDVDPYTVKKTKKSFLKQILKGFKK